MRAVVPVDAALMVLVMTGSSALMLVALLGSASSETPRELDRTVPAADARLPPPRDDQVRRAPGWVVDLFSLPAERRPVLASADLNLPLPSLAAAEPEDEPAPAAPAQAGDESFTGIWAVSEKACTPRIGRESYLPTIIRRQGAWAGETTCVFKSGRRDGKSWTFAAVCSDPSRSWRSDVHLSVDDRRLTWKSQSGSRTYVRCDRGQA